MTTGQNLTFDDDLDTEQKLTTARFSSLNVGGEGYMYSRKRTRQSQFGWNFIASTAKRFSFIGPAGLDQILLGPDLIWECVPSGKFCGLGGG